MSNLQNFGMQPKKITIINELFLFLLSEREYLGVIFTGNFSIAFADLRTKPIMSNLIHIDKEYKAWIESLVVLYRQQQVKAAVKVNEEVIRFYWALGKDISEKAYDNRYGSHFYENVSQDLRSEMGNAQGLSESNIRYAKRFYDLYFGLCANLQQVAEESRFKNFQQPAEIFNCLVSIPWG